MSATWCNICDEDLAPELLEESVCARCWRDHAAELLEGGDRDCAVVATARAQLIEARAAVFNLPLSR